MGEVLTFRRLPRGSRNSKAPVTFAGFLAAERAAPAEVVPCPAPVEFKRFCKAMNPEREVWRRLALIAEGQHEEAVRRWGRHKDECLRIARRTMTAAQAEALWERYREACRLRHKQIAGQYRTRETWALALATAWCHVSDLFPSEPDRDAGRDGVA